MFSFLYVEPKNKVEKAEAAVPILVGILGSIFLDVAVDAGIQFVDDKMAKAHADKVGKKLWDKYGDKIKDLKPTKKNAGKWALKIPKWLMAEMVDEVGDLAKDVKKKDAKRKEVGKKTSSIDVDYEGTDPLYKTGVSVDFRVDMTDAGSRKASTFIVEMLDKTLKPIAFEQKSWLMLCPAGVPYDSKVCAYQKLEGGKSYEVTGVGGSNYSWAGTKSLDGGKAESWGGEYRLDDGGMLPHWKAYEGMLKAMENANKKVYMSDGVLTTDGYDGFISLPEDIDYDKLQKVDFDKLPPKYSNEVDIEFELDASLGIDLSDILDGAEFEWERIEQDIQIKIDNGKIYNSYTFNYNPTYNIDYEISDKDQGDIDVILPPSKGDGDTDITVPGGGSSGGMVCTEDGKIIPCEKVEKIDGSLLAYVENAYEYATGFVKTAVDGLKSLGTGAVELTKLYGIFFGWLPKEIVVLMSSGLAIMLGLRIFRK